MREIRTLRAMWRALETELRSLLNGHEEGNLGHTPRRDLRATAPALDPTSVFRDSWRSSIQVFFALGTLVYLVLPRMFGLLN